jgi:hypothetical protein
LARPVHDCLAGAWGAGLDGCLRGARRCCLSPFDGRGWLPTGVAAGEMAAVAAAEAAAEELEGAGRTGAGGLAAAGGAAAAAAAAASSASRMERVATSDCMKCATASKVGLGEEGAESGSTPSSSATKTGAAKLVMLMKDGSSSAAARAMAALALTLRRVLSARASCAVRGAGGRGCICSAVNSLLSRPIYGRI